MEQDSNKQQDSGLENEPKPDRSLVYMIIGLGLLVLVMGYLTLYVDDVSSIFSAKDEVKISKTEDNSDVLSDNLAMSDEEVRISLIKFIEVFYNDQRRGYFDPPSYFPPITQTYFNFHNLTYQKIKEVHWKRLADMKNFELTWDISSLEFERSANEIYANYWTNISYFRPSRNMDVSAAVRYEIVINDEGKISSLREIEIKNLVESPRSFQSDTSDFRENDKNYQEKSNSKDDALTVESQKPESHDDSKLYDIGNVQIAPEYRGGQKALAMFLASRLRYPAKARENRIQGKVYIGFVIENNGSLSEFKVIRGIGSGCDEEAIRVLKLSPNWKAGIMNGSPVRTSYTLPISFQLPN
ncbi:energy transducer TonB [Daejeonella sp.]|jgi:TonB family protein|uniref:energy transducer TonB n=1 Tax=Daejeonella sp. TaxID=2805397 RepID=UPI0037851AE3